MSKTVLPILLSVALLVSACQPHDSSLWGSIPTPTFQPGTATPTAIQYALLPTITNTPTVTPLAVLPIQETQTPGLTQAIPTLPPVNTAGPMRAYRAQGGDTLNLVATRFGVSLPQIVSDVVLPPADELLTPGTTLLIPNQIQEPLTTGELLLPDSEVIFSRTAVDFDVENYVLLENGYLARHRESLSFGWTTGAEGIAEIATNNSINPRVLLALIEQQSGWVRGQPGNFAQDEYPLGYVNYAYRGLYRQLAWAVQALSSGYYGWRAGTLTHLTFKDGSTLRLDPGLNAGSVAVMHVLALTKNRSEWQTAIANFPALYQGMFGDPWARDAAFTHLPGGLTQPPLMLPFEQGKTWAYTGGPHGAWERGGVPAAALDFSPPAQESGCNLSPEWVVAPADGRVVRVDTGLVVLDLDGDGLEQTGWALIFLHISRENRVQQGAELKKGDRIGHPSCEGGVSTGTHVHIARKYNGEWMLADGPVPFNLDGWVALNGGGPYLGYLVRGERILEACTCGSARTHISRDPEE